MSQPVTARWWIDLTDDGRDVHDREEALERANEGHTVIEVSNASPDPAGRRVHGEIQPDGELQPRRGF